MVRAGAAPTVLQRRPDHKAAEEINALATGEQTSVGQGFCDVVELHSSHLLANEEP